MASVFLRFVPPAVPNMAKLHIWEAATKNGLYTQIEVVTNIGVYPNYIDFYTTALANNIEDWFRIQWEDNAGALVPISEPVRGATLLGEIVDRVMLRDPSANENIVVQEAEVVIAFVMGTDDVISLAPSAATLRQKAGITYLTLARVYMTGLVTQSQTTAYVAGLISEKSTDTIQTTANIQGLIDLANKELGILPGSVVLLLEEIAIGGSITSWNVDQSRLIRQIEIA